MDAAQPCSNPAHHRADGNGWTWDPYFEDGFSETLLNATYEVTLRAAETGDVLDTTTTKGASDGNCGLFVLVSDGDSKHKAVYPSPAAQLIGFLDPWISGAVI